MKLTLSTDNTIEAPTIINEDGEIVAICFGWPNHGALLAQDIVERYNAYENHTNAYPAEAELDKMAKYYGNEINQDK